ncbi:hypothetical protein [Halocatena pleomorpha]|uniref:Uncharacterized protein n=1 Tax=Halocatena pleomorpha TaxID=1785090 RepID=A0A3P3RJ74_9EURY|nr:hypothetical protein [Halocatena pleomorpha]RRJ32473.1 hypothetical protein EIK79_04410 [Halocatena pleomorpha]
MPVPSSESNSILTDRGRALCDRLTEELYTTDSRPYEEWKRLTALYGFGWSVGSGNRVAGRLPAQLNGEPIVQGSCDYVLKIEFDVDADTPHTEMGNWVEATIWKQAEERGVTDLFASVIAHAEDYRWLVMEEVETIGYDHPQGSTDPSQTQQREAYERRVSMFEQQLDDAGLGLGLDGAGQIGVSQSGNVVALDYEHVIDESGVDQPAWIGSYNRYRGERLTAEDVTQLGGRRERLRRITTGANGSITGYEIRARLNEWR